MKHRFYILKISTGTLRTKIIQNFYNIYISNYIGKTIIYNYINNHYYWPGIINIIFKYIKGCVIYKYSKYFGENKNNLFKLLSIPQRFQINIPLILLFCYLFLYIADTPTDTL